MARYERRHPENAAGPWFVDDTCIDCDACREIAPAIFGDAGQQSIVIHQPSGEVELRDAARGMLICPTASIGVRGEKPETGGLFPMEIDGGVHVCGFNPEDSYGATSYFAVRSTGNLMVDSPRFVKRLVRAFEERGGLQDILLTHRDDVADADKYAEHFGARVWIHAGDARAAPYATSIFGGLERRTIRDGLVAIPVPGHTRGSAVYLVDDRYLFTGDSLWWSPSRNGLSASREVCWYSWPEQIRSLERLRDLSFEWVLPGHGRRHHATPEDMAASLARFTTSRSA
jgi:glyoxylase-like metal-dependent hydrolase (beta-lactamase superfamily II)/ferredoxin